MSLEALSGEEERGPYELQFRTAGWSKGSARASGGSGSANGLETLEGVTGEGVRERGMESRMKKAVLRGNGESADLEKGKWWKLG